MAEKEGNLEAVLKEAVDLVCVSSFSFPTNFCVCCCTTSCWEEREKKACAFLASFSEARLPFLFYEIRISLV